ncbi:unnamed protein product [Somion occarium]|uniref:GroES-like protein n=1 Tax=Somion occarium TaxID=3059160 RepID=A0ABP1CTV3_9APHY
MSPIALPSQHAAVLHGAKDLRYEDRTLWPPQQGHVQVAVLATGLCGSDLHYYMHGRNGDFALQAPLVLGHESAGIVTAVGPGVKNFVTGQRVAIEAGIMCRDCSYCKKGRYNLCKNMRFASSAKTFPHLDGTLQDRMNHPAHVLHPLPDNCSFEQAALAEPLSVLLHASRRASFTSSSAPSTVLVFGVGAIGLLACALAKSYGATRVVAIDINQARLNFAKEQGFAEQVYCLSMTDRAKTTEDQLKRARENVGAALSAFGEPDGFDLVFECTGAEPCIQMSIHVSLRFPSPHLCSLFPPYSPPFTFPSKTGGYNRRQSHARRNGQSERHSSSERRGTPRSRHSRLVPVCEYLPGSPRSAC